MAYSIPFLSTTFVLAGKPCLTRALSQTVGFVLVGGGQVTDWHPQAFREWRCSAYSLREAVEGALCSAKTSNRLPGCGFLCCLLNVN